MRRLFYPAERPLDGRCPACGSPLAHIVLEELVDTALPWRPGNVRRAPRWICRACWQMPAATTEAKQSAPSQTRGVQSPGD